MLVMMFCDPPPHILLNWFVSLLPFPFQATTVVAAAADGVARTAATTECKKCVWGGVVLSVKPVRQCGPWSSAPSVDKFSKQKEKNISLVAAFFFFPAHFFLNKTLVFI